MKALRSRDVAERLGVSVRTLEHWRRLRKGPPWRKLGDRIVVYVEDELDEWLKARD